MEQSTGYVSALQHVVGCGKRAKVYIISDNSFISPSSAGKRVQHFPWPVSNYLGSALRTHKVTASQQTMAIWVIMKFYCRRPLSIAMYGFLRDDLRK